MFVEEEEERVKIDIYSNAISTHLWWESGITAARSTAASGYERLKIFIAFLPWLCFRNDCVFWNFPDKIRLICVMKDFARIIPQFIGALL